MRAAQRAWSSAVVGALPHKLAQGNREVFGSCMWQREICNVEAGAWWSRRVAKSGAVNVRMDGIRRESAELTEESFSELGVVLGNMGFGIILIVNEADSLFTPTGHETPLRGVVNEAA